MDKTAPEPAAKLVIEPAEQSSAGQEQATGQGGGSDQSSGGPAGARGAIYIHGSSGDLKIDFEGLKVIGRVDMIDFVKAMNVNPLGISRQQCTIYEEGGDYYIEDGVTSVQDKPSGNGTTVNGNYITGKGKTKLSNGDRIEFSTDIRATFRIA
ncbi:MAG: FHA domain-containing protein [Gammaproteobacteria bacterium]|nr:FHA domain-containing protein [Gammaproteobacteria bacterium]